MLTAAADLMKKPITADGSTSLLSVIRLLLDRRVSRVLVLEGRSVTGIATEKDLGRFLLSDSSERNLDEVRLDEIARPLRSVGIKIDVKECAGLMLEGGIGSLGVTSGSDVVGILTKTDLTAHYAKSYRGRRTVGEYMSPFYAWAHSDTKLSTVVSRMIEERISRIILRDEKHVPVGVLSFRDLFRVALAKGREASVVDDSDPVVPVVFTRKGFLADTGFGATMSAGEVMTDRIITVKYDDDLAAACNALLSNGINGAGVRSRSGTLVGILSKTDIVRAIAFLTR